MRHLLLPDARVTTPQGSTRPDAHINSRRVATFGFKSLRGFVVATRRPADQTAAAPFRRGWHEGADRSIQISPARRAAVVRLPTSIERTGGTLDIGRGENFVPSNRSAQRNGDEACRHEGASDAHNTALAAATVVPRGATLGLEGHLVHSASRGDMDGSTPGESSMEGTPAGSQSRKIRSGTRVNLAMGHRVGSNAGSSSRGARAAAILMTEYAWNDRTLSSRNSQWQAWLDFCDDEHRIPLPVTEAHLLAFIGWLKLKREAGRRNVSSASIPQYLSAVRQMQLAMTGNAVPSFPLVSHVLRGYARWEEEQFSQDEVRCGIDAVQAHRIWGLGMSSTSLLVLRDATMCVFAYCFNGLRNSSLVSIETENASLTKRTMNVRLSVVKGKEASRVELVTYDNDTELSSPFDLFLKWHSCRGTHTRYFALAGERREWTRGGLNDAFKKCAEVLDLEPPLHGKFTSHSLRIGSHTEQVLLGIPAEARLAKFGWGPSSQEMANLYFDRCIRSTASSYSFFECYVPRAPVGIPDNEPSA